jgi:hypothetical protein
VAVQQRLVVQHGPDIRLRCAVGKVLEAVAAWLHVGVDAHNVLQVWQVGAPNTARLPTHDPHN